MSEPPHGVGTTLAGGVQDMAALLPLLGTDQCEKHVGSALEGGYLYAAATPLSIFGSLGIVKLGISVLMSSISIPKPSVSFKFNPYPKFSMTFRGRRWLGARILDNAGFRPVGTVASLIAMDGKRYKAETRLMEILKEKHIENPESLAVEWRSTEWNVMLVVCTMVAAGCSIVPYIPFILPPFRPSVVHSLWIFPLLRTVGSCLAAICCQFLIQSRVISLMKNRIIFMIMNRILIKDLAIHNHVFQWDESLPSEECLWNLEWYLFSESIQVEASKFSLKPEDIRNKLLDLHNKHIHTSSFNCSFIFISWMILFLSLPATVAGYIGCFTLVSGSYGNGPLIWLGLEAAMSVIRILLWAWNPRFDERTDITLKLELANDPPLVTTEKNIETGKNTLALVPEHQFLEWITSYTGPVEQFQSSENLALYFTLTGNETGQKCLYLTVFDINKRIAVTLHKEKEELSYIDAIVTCNNIASEMEATLQSTIDKDHPWGTNHAILFDALSHYYFSIIHALNQSHLQSTTSDNFPRYQMFLETLMHCFQSPATNARMNNEAKTVLLPQKWNLLSKDVQSNNQTPASIPKPLSLMKHDRLYLQQGYEHHLKTKLVKNWSRWIIDNIDSIKSDAQNDCHHALVDRTSDKAKWELIELDRQLASEWTRREWSLLISSLDLEDVLYQRMEECVKQIVTKEQNEQLKEWMRSEFAVGQQKRLEKERGHVKERMAKEMKISAECAETEGRAWRDQYGNFSPKVMWEAGQKFINEQWEEAIKGRKVALAEELHLDQLVENNTPKSPSMENEEDKARCTFVELVRSRFKHWQSQHRNERHEMNVTIKHINNADIEHLNGAYQYPKSSWLVISRFVESGFSQLQAKICSATVYDMWRCNKDSMCNVIQKSTTHSVINVDPDLVDSISENDHLLYLSFYGRHLQEPSFIQQNRERWWHQQTSNSSTFYFSHNS